MSYYGKDGGKYDSVYDVNAANRRYEQNEARNKLLKEQNELMKRNAIIEADLQKAKLQHEQEMKKMEVESQKELLLLQMEHEKEMRILALFDEAGLSKDSYDQFMNILFLLAPQKNENEQFNELCKDYKKQLKDIDKYYEDPENNFKYVENILIDCQNKKLEYYDMKTELVAYLKGERKNNTAKLVEYFKENEEYKKNRSSKIKTSIIIFIVSVIIIFAVALLMDPEYAMYMYLISVIVALVYLIKGLTVLPTNEMVEKELESLQDKIDNIDKYHNFDEQIKERKALMEDAISSNETINEMFDKKLKTFESIWNIFVEFREEHYNSKIEKILIETGVKEKVESTGLSYKKINSANKISDGTIEEYEIFFDEAINSTKEGLASK